MTISLIVAMDRHFLIGAETGLPWHLPVDLRRFRRLTMGKPMIMGRQTHEMIGRPLDGRLNLVLTRQADYAPERVTVAHSIDEALRIAEDHLTETGGGEIMIIGGAGIYHQTISRCNRIYLTVIDGDFKGTVYFPSEAMSTREWRIQLQQRHPADEKNAYPHSYAILERWSSTSSESTPFTLAEIVQKI